jgi:hypothetical protein
MARAKPGLYSLAAGDEQSVNRQTGLALRPPFAMLRGRQIATTMRHRRTEDRLSMARRHVAEGEERVARQEILIAELDRDGHPELAVEARELLATLQTSLRLQRDDLSLIESVSRGSSPE